MRSPVARVVKNSVRAGQDLASQIVVSVAAAVCVGFITNAYFEQKPPASEPAAAQTTEQGVDAVVNAPIRIIGEATNTSVLAGQPPRPLPPTAEPLVRDVAGVSLPAVTGPGAETAAASLPLLASEIIVDLPVRDVTAMPEGAEIFPGVPAALAESIRMSVSVAEQQPERRRFLGLPLPYFVPTASDLMQSASAAGGRIAEIVDRR